MDALPELVRWWWGGGVPSLPFPLSTILFFGALAALVLQVKHLVRKR